MKLYEGVRAVLAPVMPALHGEVRSDIRRLIRSSPGEPRLLDVGGRNSPYTVGIPARITVLDLARASELEEIKKLGFTDGIVSTLKRRRSNVEDVVLMDMTHSELPEGSFDGVLSVEVLEHVEDDDAFVRNCARALRPEGWFYCTTPNGDYLKLDRDRTPQHLRHYSRRQLHDLLAHHFGRVDVRYAVATGEHRVRGIKAIDPKRPLDAARTMTANIVNRRESQDVAEKASGTAHLVGICREPHLYL